MGIRQAILDRIVQGVQLGQMKVWQGMDQSSPQTMFIVSAVGSSILGEDGIDAAAVKEHRHGRPGDLGAM